MGGGGGVHAGDNHMYFILEGIHTRVWGIRNAERKMARVRKSNLSQSKNSYIAKLLYWQSSPHTMGSALVYKRTRSVKEYSFTDWSISEYSFIDGATDPIRGVRSWTVHKRTNLNKSSTSP